MARKQKSFLSDLSMQMLVRLIAGSFFVAVAALNWDTWWHRGASTDAFLIPPHILLVVGIIGIFLGSLAAIVRSKEVVWKELASVSGLLLLAIPFDLVSHASVQSLVSAASFWNPLHLVVFGGLLGSALLFLPCVEKEKDATARYVLSVMMWGIILDLAFILTIPFFPLGTYHIIGFWGSGVIALIVIFMLLHIQQVVARFGAATLSAFVFLILHAMSVQIVPLPGLDVTPYADIPNWLLVMAFMIPGLIADSTTHFRSWFRGMLMGLAFSGTLYTFASCFIKLEFQYQMNEAMAAIITSIVAGIIAGIVVEIHRGKEPTPLT